ncbi:hypothetical protein POUND7_007380 [Theobroma cacao]
MKQGRPAAKRKEYRKLPEQWSEEI